MRAWMLLGVLLCLRAQYLNAAPPENVWIFFSDKPDGKGDRILWHEEVDAHGSEELGLPLDPDYLACLQEAGIVVRFRSRWLNAVSAYATVEQQRWLVDQPGVRRIQPVRRFRRPSGPREEAVQKKAGKASSAFDYGFSFEQLAQIGTIALHYMGYDGEGVRVALLDNGFHYQHRAFARLRVIAERDFVNGDDVVLDEAGQPVTGDETKSEQNVHGAQVLSLLAGYDPGRFIGVAPGAGYILAKTEDNGSEFPIEEDRWIAGLEWADSLDADVVNSSLGYNIWDDGSGYTYEQLDGATALTSRAAAAAVRRGIVVVAAAGNEGDGVWRYVTAPADAPGVISVGAVDIPTPGTLPSLAPFSSRGPTADNRIKPDVVAPGQGVIVVDVRGDGYETELGTSFAAPLVSGVCALLLQIHPSWGPAEMLDALRRSALDLGAPGADTDYGWGQVDALRASGKDLQYPDALLAGDPFPNPAVGGVVHFPVQLVERDEIELRVFDLAGNLIFAKEWSLMPGDYTGPERALRWEAQGMEGERRIASGLFFYQLKASSFRRSGKIALIRR